MTGTSTTCFPLTCADDAEAIEMAKKLVIDRDVELWQLDEDWHVQPQAKNDALKL